MGVLEGAQPLHQAPSGAAAKRRGGKKAIPLRNHALIRGTQRAVFAP